MSSATGTTPQGDARLRDLGARIAGDVVLPGDDGFDAARLSWNLAVDQRPVAVVFPESADDVAATVKVAAAAGLRIAFNAGGHNAGPIDWSADTVLLKFERMSHVDVDPEAGRARIGAGALANQLSRAAGEHGLAYLSGTSPDVGIGYLLGGGLSWMARAHGFACNAIVAADVVTADGRQIRTDAEHEPDLFWALRGGGGNVAAVTGLELSLIPMREIYAGAMFWPIERATEILNAWRAWIDTVPEACESLGRLLQLPDAPFLPDHLRGRSFVMVEAAIIGTEADAAALIQPFRDLGPEMDTMAMIPPNDLVLVHMDPDVPTPYAGDGTLLAALSAETIDRMVEAFVGSPLLHAEVRHLGGAVARSSPDHGILDAIDEPFILFTFGMAMDAAMQAAVEAHVRGLLGALQPWDSGRRFLNFTESRVDPRSIFPAATYDRFLEVKARYDPTGIFEANHSIRQVG